MIPIFAFAAFSIDVGRICLVKTQMQIAADAAALAGARASGDPATTRSNAVAAAAQNFADGTAVSITASNVELGNWDDSKWTFTTLTGSAESSANAVRVTCSRTAGSKNATPLFLAPLIGHKTADLSVSSIAKMKPGRCGLIIGLSFVTMSSSSHTDSYKSASGAYDPKNAGSAGHVCSNGMITMSGSSAIHGDAHPGPGCTVKSSSSAGATGKITPLTKAMSYGTVDPGNAATINDNSKVPISKNGKVAVDSKGNFTLSGGDSVTLPPGTYYFAKFTLSGGSSVSVTGATTIYTTGDFAISGSSIANATILPKNLQLFPMGSKCDISGTSDLYAVVYGPNTAITRSGASDFYGAVIGANITLSGSGGMHADESLGFTYLTNGKNLSNLVH